MKPSPKALLMTYGSPESENRLRTQLHALLELGFEVHTLGMGEVKLHGVASHFRLRARSQRVLSRALSLFVHIFFPPKLRFALLVQSRIPIRQIRTSRIRFDLVVNHDLELLPFLINFETKTKSRNRVRKQLDLHEYHEYTEQSGKGLHRYLSRSLRRYHSELLTNVYSHAIDLVTVVGPSIRAKYEEVEPFKNSIIIMNCAPESGIALENRSSENLNAIYHGKLAGNRSLESLVEASKYFKDEINLTLMLTGNKAEINQFNLWTNRENPKVSFIESVLMEKVSEEISKYDFEIIFFPPVTENLRLTLPNKLFEAVQANLAIVGGESPDLMKIIFDYKIGEVVYGWSPQNLANTVNGLTRDKIESFRESSRAAARILNSVSERKKLQQAWAAILGL